jgi:hypothetical protein
MSLDKLFGIYTVAFIAVTILIGIGRSSWPPNT